MKFLKSYVKEGRARAQDVKSINRPHLAVDRRQMRMILIYNFTRRRSRMNGIHDDPKQHENVSLDRSAD